MPDTKRPLKVFLCHASADKPKVRELYRTLKRRGVQPWLDAEDLIPGRIGKWKSARLYARVVDFGEDSVYTRKIEILTYINLM